MVSPFSPWISSKPITNDKSIPRGATKPRAIAQALVAWLTALATMARILGECPATTERATIEPTLWGLLVPDTLTISSTGCYSDMIYSVLNNWYLCNTMSNRPLLVTQPSQIT